MVKIDEIRKLFLEKEEVVGDIEKTFGNYDRNGNLIEYSIPTITTEFCEIGVYSEIVYFTFVIYSDSYNKKLFDNLKDLSNFKVYGFKSFLENFNLYEIEDKIKKEKYFQINFDYSSIDNVEYLYEQYSKIKNLILDSGVKVVNQLEVDLTEK